LIVFTTRPLDHVCRTGIVLPRLGVGLFGIESALCGAHEALEETGGIALEN